ncbi:glucose-6-phosphate isomerase [Helicobacter mastomyrinus]|uniref:Glucose-6-phosphate isomerase n=1 Tax=Helicobacter mastomyrinus TaxID=287948 RepID=A0ABZ3F3M4_9HELI|nr:glucose-6-phosphate isomerase [uncultured Helicobacter sp.]
MLTFSSHFKDIAPSKEAQDRLFNAILQERQMQKSGYYNLPYDNQALEEAYQYVRQNEAFLDTIAHLVIIGVGGSSLGLKAIDSMLRHLPCRKKLDLIFLEHTDPLHITQSLEHISIQNALFIVISKSGTTIESISLLKYMLDRYEILQNAQNKAHLFVITDNRSPLESWAKQHNLHCFHIPPNVGGRFSILSAVGIVPLAILGFDVEALLRGGRNMADDFFERRAEHILHKALVYATHREQIPMNVLFSYSSFFEHFNAWYVQLWGESLGKINVHHQKIGLTPIALIGSIDQHSFLQLIVQGKADKSVTFLSVNPAHNLIPCIPSLELTFLESTDFVNGKSFATLLNNQRIATMQTIANEGILTDCIEVMRLCEESIGMLIMYFELLTSCMGILFEINTYDQPGVEYGKQRLKALFDV